MTINASTLQAVLSALLTDASASSSGTIPLQSSNGDVLIRTQNAGVHFGRLVARTDSEVELANARRIWSWKGANTLHEISLRGVEKGSKISESVPSIRVLGVLEIIPLQPAAVTALAAISW